MVPPSSDKTTTNNETPLLSEQGKNFLAGKIDADEYIKDGRRRAENLAVREVNERVRFRSTRPFRTWLAAVGFVVYGSLALQSFFQSKDTTTAVLALITSLFLGGMVGSIIARRERSRRRSKAKADSGSSLTEHRHAA
jgi:hypothetical protein